MLSRLSMSYWYNAKPWSIDILVVKTPFGQKVLRVVTVAFAKKIILPCKLRKLPHQPPLCN